MPNKLVLFYSPNCQHSIQLWKNLKTKNLLDKFTKINVLKLENIPSNITRTPTLMVPGRPPIVGQAIDFYLNSNSVVEKTTAQVKSNNSNSLPSNSNSIQDFNFCEMSSNWSDNYSFIDSENPINHSYSFLNSKEVSITPENGSNTDSRKSAKADEMQKRFEALKNARNNDMHLKG